MRVVVMMMMMMMLETKAFRVGGRIGNRRVVRAYAEVCGFEGPGVWRIIKHATQETGSR
mgnify:CR=1 FL=1